MNKYMLILFLITTHLIASSQTNQVILKAKQKNDVVEVKILIKGLISLRRAISSTGDQRNIYFIKHVSANINGDILYDISLARTVRQENSLLLMFDFLYKGRGDTINIVVIDSKNKQTMHSIKIKNSLAKRTLLNSKNIPLKPINYWNEKPKLWNLTDTKKAIRELYGTKKPQIGTIDISLTKYTDYWYFAPIKITSKVKLKSIAIFSDDLTNPSHREKIPSIRAVISMYEGTTINYSKSFYILTSGTCCKDDYVPITVVGIDKDENLHKVVLDTELACSADCEM